MGKRVGLGMNKFELAQNKQLSEYVAQNLNKNPQFPFPDNTFDVVTCVVSIDYLNKPLEIFKEVRRVLKPGGRFIVSQSNRCFPTKAIQIWLNTNDMEHIFIIGSYFHYAGGFTPAAAFDISPSRGALFGSDPMYIIQGEKA
jgi:ubiquinone/menaquinone biosynthesis C-methylase UbiE